MMSHKNLMLKLIQFKKDENNFHLFILFILFKLKKWQHIQTKFSSTLVYIK